jgi:hypothetical protein
MPPSFARVLLSALLLAPLAACAGSGYQKVPMPAAGSAVQADSVRVYILRDDVVAGSRRHLLVSDGGVEIGALAEDEYMCWDRAAKQGAGHLIFQGVDPAQRGVESFFELPAEPGKTAYFLVRIEREDRKPMVERVPEAEGAALVAKRKAAALKTSP